MPAATASASALSFPESFKVLVKELQALALDINVLDKDNNVVELKESIDYGETSFNAILNNDSKNYSQNKEDSQDFAKAGYHTQEFVGEELQTVNADGTVFEDGQEN